MFRAEWGWGWTKNSAESTRTSSVLIAKSCSIRWHPWSCSHFRKYFLLRDLSEENMKIQPQLWTSAVFEPQLELTNSFGFLKEFLTPFNEFAYEYVFNTFSLKMETQRLSLNNWSTNPIKSIPWPLVKSHTNWHSPRPCHVLLSARSTVGRKQEPKTQAKAMFGFD